MALPLPNPAQLGGDIIGSNIATNALTASNLQNEINRVKAQYAALTAQADAASKLTYANLMGPQFAAKLMGNPDILASWPGAKEGGREDALNKVVGAAFGLGGAGGGLPINTNNLFTPNPYAGTGSFGNIIALARKIFGSGNQQQNQIPVQNALLNNPANNPNTNPVQPTGQRGTGYDSGYSYDKNGNNIVATPQEVENIANNGNNFTTSPNYNPDQFYENRARTAGIVKQGEEQGTLRAKAIDEMDQQFQQAVQSEVPIKRLIELSQSPTFMNMRNKVPYFQDKQLWFLSKNGTPEEQKLIGDFITDTTNAVANTVNSFGGRALVKEFDIGERMKISPNDTWNVMIGKLGSIATFNEMTKQRARIASQLMDKEHMTRGDALEKADKMVNGDAIRKSVEKQLDPQPTEADINYMAKKYNESPEEIKKKLKHKGYKLEIKLMGEK